MDLLSLDGGERYHTLAALIDIGTQEQDEFLLTGFLPDDRRDRVSRIIHEVTHVGSLRTTRLGFLIARVGAEALRGRKQITRRSLVVPEIAETLLGAFSPLLEGLALYGQLDYRIDDEDDILPFPINKIAANNTADFLMSANGVPDAIRNAQLAAIWGLSAGPSRIGLLSALLLDDDAETEHYFAGYLFVKAIAARFGRLDCRLADPATFLPLLVRLTCDHPILEAACFEPMSCHQVIEPVLRYVQEISRDDLSRILRMLEREDVRTNFDNWDIHTQLAAPDDAAPILHTQDNVICSGMLANQMFSELRAATSVHLTSWIAGTPRARDFQNAEAVIQISSNGHDTTVRIACHSALNAFSSGIDAKSREALERFETMFHAQLARATQRKLDVAVGSYVTLTRGSAGMALWVKERLAAIIPLSLLDSRLDETETWVALEGLKMSPTFRRNFAEVLRSSDALRASNRQADARSEAADMMMARLVSDPTWGTIALRCRLAGLLPLPLASSIRDWCCCALSPGGDPVFPAEVSAVLSTIFDRPGGTTSHFEELVPDLRALADHLKRLQKRQQHGAHDA